MIELFAAIAFNGMIQRAPESALLESWRDEALLRGRDSALWIQGDCPQLIVKVSSHSGSSENAILLHSTTLLAAKIHHDALELLKSNSRDIYWAVTCGGISTATFIHSFFKKLEGFEAELSTSEKVQLATIGKLFPDLSKVKFVWNEGAPFDSSTFAPWIMAPIGISQRGLWSGRVRFQALNPGDDIASDWAKKNGLLMTALEHLQNSSRASKWSLRSLHYELAELVSRFSRSDSAWNRFQNFFLPRLFFYRREWDWMLSSRWVTNGFSPLSENGQGEVLLDFYFLGSKEQREIERELSDELLEVLGPEVSVDIETIHLSGFQRSVFEGKEARAIEDVLRRLPQVVPVPVISTELSESRFFREAGLAVFELLPLQISQPFFQPTDFDSLPLKGESIHKAAEIEAKILKEAL